MPVPVRGWNEYQVRGGIDLLELREEAIDFGLPAFSPFGSHDEVGRMVGRRGRGRGRVDGRDRSLLKAGSGCVRVDMVTSGLGVHTA